MPRQNNDTAKGITEVTVQGFKSLRDRTTIEVRPLTILAGANSSGKSSAIQPLLLLKQTLEASYDPGALLLNGPNVKFTSIEQLLSRTGKNSLADSFSVGLGVGPGFHLDLRYGKGTRRAIDIEEMNWQIGSESGTLRPGMSQGEIFKSLPGELHQIYDAFTMRYPAHWVAYRNRCFLYLEIRLDGDSKEQLYSTSFPSFYFQSHLLELIHLPGLRGNPERLYPTTAVESQYPGTFEKYVASIIAQWQAEKEAEELEKLGAQLSLLGLTWKVAAKPMNDTQVELQVGRLPRAARGGGQDLVNIADVGFGLSQTLPVVVALLAAKPGQLVYLEQPEIWSAPQELVQVV